MATSTPVTIKGRDMEILYKHACGLKNKDIAAILGISEQTVSTTINSDWAKNELALLHARTLDKIANGTYSPIAYARAFANEAIAIQVSLMRSPAVKANVRARIADSILDRAGYRPAQRVESIDLNEVFEKMSPEELDEYATTGNLPERFSGTQVSRFLGSAGDIEPDYSSDYGANSIDPVRQSETIELDLDDE